MIFKWFQYSFLFGFFLLFFNQLAFDTTIPKRLLLNGPSENK